jgi:DNA polymerase-3 subunit epsilon
MKALVYDCETDKLPLWKEPSDDPRQPHIVQLAAALVDTETRATISSMDVIIRPDGWTIPPDMTAIHGISYEFARLVGVEEVKALILFHELWTRSDFRVGFNEKFDARIIRIGMKRFLRGNEAAHDAWKAGRSECAMWAAKMVMGVGKLPTLGEAYKHFCGVDLQFAHSAMADVLACKAVYFAITQGVKTDGTTT